MEIQTVLIIGMAGAFIVSAIDYFKELGFWRPVIAFLFGAVMAVAQDFPRDIQGWVFTLVVGLSSAFATMALLKIVERLNIVQARIR